MTDFWLSPQVFLPLMFFLIGGFGFGIDDVRNTRICRARGIRNMDNYFLRFIRITPGYWLARWLFDPR